MKTMFSRLAAIVDQVRTWGMVLPRAAGDHGTQVRVYGPDRVGEQHLVGTLWQEQGDFVFKYETSFATSPEAEPIAAFPELDETYRSPELWPFFAVRIPPLRRADVRDYLESQGVTPDKTLEVLGVLAKKSATNPYELRLERSPDGSRKGPDGRAMPPAAAVA